MWSTDQSVTFADRYMSVKRKVDYINGYAVIDLASLTMSMILLTSILINLISRSFQCEFASQKNYTIGLTIQAQQHRRQKEDYWIRKLGTATPYGCNDKLDGIGILCSPTCISVNVINIFNSSPRHYTSPILVVPIRISLIQGCC